MNLFDTQQSEAHEAFVRTLDAAADAAAASSASVAPSDSDPAAPAAGPRERRLGATRLLLLAGGEAGRQAVLALRRLPLRHLSVWPLRKQDVALLSPLVADAGAIGRLQVLPKPFTPYAAATAFQAHQAVAFASSRPHPQKQRDINDLCVRHGLPWTQLSLNAHEIYLGPTVLPGVTACQACHEVRAMASAAKPDVHRAQIEYFDRNPDFEFKGQLQSLDRMAAAYLCSEIERLLTNVQPPIALSRLVRMDGLYLSQDRHFIPYYEWCPVCRKGAGPASGLRRGDAVARPSFADFIQSCEER